jgi:hypothetical protein
MSARQWCRMFKDGQTNVHNVEQSVQPPVVCDDLIQSVNQKSAKDGSSKHQNFHVNFHIFHILFTTRITQLG